MTIEQECRDAEEARLERHERVSAGQSKGDYLWAKSKRVDKIDKAQNERLRKLREERE